MNAAQIVHESPLVCDPSKLTAAERSRLQEISGRLAAKQLGIRELPDGYEFSFPGDTATIQMVTEWVVSERLCCPFLDIDVRLSREAGAATVRLTGRPGTKDFIKADFGGWLAR